MVRSPCSPRDSQESSPTPQFKSINSLALSLLFGPTHICIWLLEKKNTALSFQTYISKVMSLLFDTPSELIIAFLPRSKSLSISWLQWQSAVIVESKKINSVTVFCFFPPFICHDMMRLDAMIFIFWMLSFKQTFSFSSFTFIKRIFSFSLVSATRVVSSAHQGIDISSGNLESTLNIFQFSILPC